MEENSKPKNVKHHRKIYESFGNLRAVKVRYMWHMVLFVLMKPKNSPIFTFVRNKEFTKEPSAIPK